MARLDGKVAIVTGAAGGLGGAIARRFAAEGARVVATDIAGDAVAGCRFERHDVTDEAGWARVVAAAREEGGADVLVNAAGIEGDLAQGGLATTLAEWRRVIGVNLDGTFLGCRAAMPDMLEKGAGAIVNISSIVSVMGSPSGLAYGAGKAAVEQLTRSLTLIGAEGGRRVRVNSIHPGVIRTRMTDDIIATFAARQGVDAAAGEAAVMAAVPFGERGTPDDVAALALFLAGDEAAYVTGAMFKVDGGWSVTGAG